MHMNKFEFVEDYIEIIGGFRNVNGQLESTWIFGSTPLLSLARYDTSVLENLSAQGINKIAYTDRQAKLAVDLVLKYERQLIKQGVDISPVKENPEFRLPLRTLDRTQRVWIDGDIIKIHFPYQDSFIQAIRTESKDSKGFIRFDRQQKVWEAALTEHNVNWVYAFAQTNNFVIDSSLQTVMDNLLAVEQQQFQIELQATPEMLHITNATDSLIEYVTEVAGGFELDNLLTLVDAAPILGYKIEKIIEESVIEAYGSRFYSLCANRELKIDMGSVRGDQISAIVQYAYTTNRFPIYVYEPDLTNQLSGMFTRLFDDNEVHNLDSEGEVPLDVKLVYTGRIPKVPITKIPLLISGAGMIFGGDRQLWLQTAEKVVYFSNDVYNKTTVKKGNSVCKLS